MKKSTPYLLALIAVILIASILGGIQENRAWEEAANAHQQNTFILIQIAQLLQGLLVAVLFAAVYIKKALEPKNKETKSEE